MQYWFNDSLLSYSELLIRELVTEEVIFVLVKQPKSCCSMEILLNAFLTIHLIERWLGDDMVSIIKTIMFDIMTECGDKKSKRVGIIKLGVFYQILRFKNHMTMLGNITSMQIVMILNVAFVQVIDLGEKLEKFGIIHQMKQIILF